MAMCLFLFSFLYETELPRASSGRRQVVRPADFLSASYILRDDGHVWVTDWHKGHKKALRKRINLSCFIKAPFYLVFHTFL